MNLTLEQAQAEISRLTDELGDKRSTMSDGDFMKEVSVYKNKCEETYNKLNALDWLIHKNINVCGVVIQLNKTPKVWNACNLDHQSICALIWIIQVAKKDGEQEYDFEKCYFNVEKIKGMRNAYKICFHTK